MSKGHAMNDKKRNALPPRRATIVGRKLREKGVVPLKCDILHVDDDGKGRLYCPSNPELTARIIEMAKGLDMSIKPRIADHFYASGQPKYRPELDMQTVEELIQFMRSHPNQEERLVNAMYRVRELVDKTVELNDAGAN